jgi:hypothetical protein
MAKTQKELAFLLDLSVAGEWTQRFADLVDKHLDLSDSENLLYINAGTGTHALAIDERFGDKTDIFASADNEDILNIAVDKAAALSSNVDFSMLRFENDAFDTVLADGSMVSPANVEAFIDDAIRVARTGGEVAVFLPTAGSFGEIASLLWEVLFSEDLGEHGAAAEKLISDQPTVSRLEDIAANAGLVNVKTETAIEIFEYEDGAAFIASPLIGDFLLPAWLDSLDEDEKERVFERLAQLIEEENGPLPFYFTVKATLLTGEKS